MSLGRVWELGEDNMTLYLPNYTTYYGVQDNSFFYSWGQVNYRKVLIEDFPPDNVSVDISETTSSPIGTVAIFLLPNPHGNRYDIDGWVIGWFRLENFHASTETTISSYDASLIKIEIDGTQTVVGAYTTDSMGLTLAAHDSIVLPIRFNVSRAEINENERLALKLDVSGTGGTTMFVHAMWQGATYQDIRIDIPYAPIA
jgi:hypothetical protein